MSVYLSITACFRDEQESLGEWIDFHLGVGVEHFFLYDNRSADRYLEVVQPHIDRGIVTLVSWPVVCGQMRAYADAVRRFGAATRWMAFIDIDEFLFSPLGQDIRPALKPYEHFSAVAVNWVNYGSSGYTQAPQAPVTHAYLRRGELDVVVPYPHLRKSPLTDPASASSYRPLNSHVKTIANPQRVAGCANPHFLTYTKGYAVSELGVPVCGPWSDSVSVERFRCNHYWSKSREDMEKKIARGRADGGPLRTLAEFEERDRYLNKVVDPAAIERYPIKEMAESIVP